MNARRKGIPLTGIDEDVPWLWRAARGVYDWWHPARIDVRPAMARDERGRLVSAGAQWFETRAWVGKAVEWAGMTVFALTVLAALVVVWKVLGYAEIYRYDRERIARVWHLYNVKLGLDATLTIATLTVVAGVIVFMFLLRVGVPRRELWFDADGGMRLPRGVATAPPWIHAIGGHHGNVRSIEQFGREVRVYLSDGSFLPICYDQHPEVALQLATTLNNALAAIRAQSAPVPAAQARHRRVVD